MDQVVLAVLAAAERQDWPTVRLLLHPYLHWTQDGVALRGRTTVMARLTAQPHLTAPATYELRDGQVYRWTAP
ncbi:hypothetical protein ACQPZQ_17615 [Pseudonocardia sp. CA-142604]|uniref:hypothetical protein n=1 Tax=Pseudonocardia sp. CA-142604 TaxID=3240024 RepID=UPI003D91D9F7